MQVASESSTTEPLSPASLPSDEAPTTDSEESSEEDSPQSVQKPPRKKMKSTKRRKVTRFDYSMPIIEEDEEDVDSDDEDIDYDNSGYQYYKDALDRDLI